MPRMLHTPRVGHCSFSPSYEILLVEFRYNVLGYRRVIGGFLQWTTDTK